MYFKQFYLGCLAHASYLIGSDGEAAVVDPQRDVDQYVNEANEHGFRIKYVIETHLHADFVSGHRELALRTGAEIAFGSRAGVQFPHLDLTDGDELRVGSITLRILETPGHTPESISILVIDSSESAEPKMVLTGDTLFIGDVGRPDLVGSKGYSAEAMAGMLYDSLHSKLLTLSDTTEVYPAHGAGSMCGRNISKETHSTIGEQRRFNYALAPMTKESFVKMMTSDLPEAPAYFSRDAEINRAGAGALTEISRPAAFEATSVKWLAKRGHLLLDLRPSPAFGTGHVPGSLNIGLGGQFATWAGSLITPSTRIILIAEDEAEIDEAVTRLARVGIESVDGYLKGGVLGWADAGFDLATIGQMPVDELRHRIEERANLQVIDVRKPAEFKSGHVPGAVNLTLSHLADQIPSVDASRPVAVICQSGYRSMAASSILERHGLSEIYNVVGGTAAWTAAGFAVDTDGWNVGMRLEKDRFFI